MIVLDFETRSHADLTKVGAWNYSLDPTTDVIVMAYLIDGAEIKTWEPGQPYPQDLVDAIYEGSTVEAHNVSFEEAIWENVLVPKYGFPPVPEDNWRDTMAVACYLALPAALDKLSLALGGEGKDPEGGRLISKYSKLHLATAKTEIPPEDMAKWRNYVCDDVAQEAGIGDFLGDLPVRELSIFLLDRRTNRRGLFLDREGIAAASAIVDQRSEELAARFREVTGGLNPSQTAKVLDWLGEQGYELPNLQRATIQYVLKDGEAAEAEEGEPGRFEPERADPKIALERADPKTAPEAREALELRLKINKASTRKLDAMARNAGPDGRARNQTRYHGATTGRSTGAGFQPLNLIRGSFDNVPPELLVQSIMAGNAEMLDMMYGDAMDAVSKASRHWIMAEPGRRLIAGDFVSIEAVILACLAGEQWKIDAFRTGEKIYERMGDRIYGLPLGTVTKATHPLERQDGKIGELAFGYQGALGAWRNFDKSDRHSDERVVEICKAWRAEHPRIVELWREYEGHMQFALLNPGRVSEYRGVQFCTENEWLTIRLLNRKKLWYFDPQFRSRMPAWHRPEDKEECKTGECGHEPQMVVTYMSMKNGKWQRVSTYGGKITENVVQATSREILESAKLRIDATPEFRDTIVLSVYDEVVSEVPNGVGTVEQFEALMLEREDWFADWPVSVDVWEGERYRK